MARCGLAGGPERAGSPAAVHEAASPRTAWARRRRGRRGPDGVRAPTHRAGGGVGRLGGGARTGRGDDGLGTRGGGGGEGGGGRGGPCNYYRYVPPSPVKG